MPLVSVIIPAYNAASTIGEALNSVLVQDFEEAIEIIVTNDGSTDSTQSVLDSFGERITVIRQKNQGQPVARNVAIERSQGEYLALLDADDMWLPGRLAKTVSALERNPAAVLAFSDYIRIDPDGNLVEETAVAKHLSHAPSMEDILGYWWPISPTTVTMRRELYEACGGFVAEAKGFEDLLFFIAARERGEFEYISEALARFRMTYSERLAEKWSPDVFLRIIAKRYGNRASKLLREVRAQYAASFAVMALKAMERGERRDTVRCWRKVFRYDPFFLFRGDLVRRFPRRHNLRRLTQVLRRKPSV
jgi:glycosyltransferase involved in cell wall biosynthesis